MTKPTLNLDDLELGHRLHLLGCVYVALAVTANSDDSWTKTELRDTANALATIGRAMLAQVESEITERLGT